MINFNKSFLAITLILFFAQLVQAQIQTRLNELVNDSRLQSATVAFCLTDVKTGEILLQHNASKAVIPASLMKISTTIAALEVIGSNAIFSTSVFSLGEIEDGILTGDLMIVGGGDPTLGSSFFGQYTAFENAVTETLKSNGVKKITGSFWIDERYFNNDVPASWSWEDISNYYASPARSLNYRDNTIELIFKTGAKGSVAQLISTQPKVPNLMVESQVLAAEISSDEAYCFAAPDDFRMVVKGSLPANRAEFSVKAALPEPGLFLGHVVAESFQNAGIEFEGDVKKMKDDSPLKNQNKALIYQMKSPSVREIVRITNRNSVNLFAETLAKQVSKKLSPESQNPYQQLNTFWKGKLTSSIGLNVKDGSGLSHYNTITVSQLCEMLVYANKANYAGDFKSSLPAAGKEGTLRNFGKGTSLENNMIAKSGYMTGSRGYAGYMKLKSGREVAVTLMVNHYSISAGEMRKILESFLTAVAEGELK